MLKRAGDESRFESEALIQTPPLGTQLDFNNPLNKGLVMHLAMNEGHGDVVRDLSMNGNHGTLKDMAFPSTPVSGWNPGRTGVGLNFDGTDDYIDCGNNASLDVTDEITISVWVKFDSIAAYNRILGKVDTVPTTNGYFLFTDTDTIRLGLRNSSNPYDVISTTIISTGIWYNVVGIYNKSNCLIYVNAIETVGDAYTGAIGVSTDSLRIGTYLPVMGGYDNGSIDQVRIHNRALTAKEVQDYYINPWQVYEQ